MAKLYPLELPNKPNKTSLHKTYKAYVCIPFSVQSLLDNEDSFDVVELKRSFLFLLFCIRITYSTVNLLWFN
jgi:hypothetical protein